MKFVYICDIYNLYYTMAWPASNIEYHKFYSNLLQLLYDKAAFQRIVLEQLS